MLSSLNYLQYLYYENSFNSSFLTPRKTAAVNLDGQGKEWFPLLPSLHHSKPYIQQWRAGCTAKSQEGSHWGSANSTKAACLNQTGSARQTEHIQSLHNPASSFCCGSIHTTLVPLFPTCPSLPVVGYNTHMIHHTGTCHPQESNFGVKVLEKPFLRVCELLLFFTRLQMLSSHDRRNTRGFCGFSLTQHSGTQPDPSQHTLTSTLCNSTTSTWRPHDSLGANRPISSWLNYLLCPLCTHRKPEQRNLVST